MTPEEAAAGFEVRQVDHPDGPPATVPAAVHACADPSHRLVETRGGDGEVASQLQAFGGGRADFGPLDWFAERYWPGRYGPVWVLDRLREHLDRPRYQALIDLHRPPAEPDQPVPAGSVERV